MIVEPVHGVRLGHLHSLGRVHGLTAYDAAYLELAQRKWAYPLATFDVALRKAAVSEGLKLLPETL